MDRLTYIAGLMAAMGITAAPSVSAADGEGAARLLSPERLIVGSQERVEVELTVGPSGIAAGGGMSLGFHHAATWRGLQITAPNRPGYMTVTCDTPDNLEISWHEWAPDGMFEKRQGLAQDAIYHRVLVAQVKERALEPDERVTFTIGANDAVATVPSFVVESHEFRITTDVDGDGAFSGIGESPAMPIEPAEARELVASVPATLVAGEPFELQIRAEDEFHNLATSYSGEVVMRAEDGARLAQDVAVRDGIGLVELRAPDPGPQRFRVSDGRLEGRSNPCRVFAEVPELRLYWGDIHGHTIISDGLGPSADSYFAFGRDVADLDVCALTDHGHFDWPQTIDAAKAFYDAGEFVTLLAQEAGATADHLNLYFRGDDTPHIDGWATEYDQFYEMVHEQYNSGDRPEVIVGPHHFTYPRGDERYPFGLFDTRTARFAEVYSSHGTSEYLGNPRPLAGAKDEDKFLQAGLARGLRFGVIASSDNHDSHPGRSIWGHYPGGLVGFLAPELTREAIFDALWNRRVYATSFDRIYLEFTIDGHPMGSDVAVDGPCRISYTVIGRTDDLEVFLIRNNEEHRLDTTDDGVVEVSFEHTPPEGESFYYLRVVQDNGERAWSTPIWVTR